MSTLKENLIKIGFKADEADTILEKMPADDQQNYASFSMPELALKAGNFKNQYLKKSTVLKKKLTIPGAPEEEDTTTMVFKRSSLPDAAVDTQSATSSNKPTLNMNATGVVSSSSKLQKAGSSINLQKPGGTLLDSNIAPAKPAPSLNKPGSNLKKPGSESALPPEIDADMGIPTMSFKRDSLPGAAKDINEPKPTTKTPGSGLSALNSGAGSSPAATPGAKPEFQLKGASLKKPSENKANSDDALEGMDLNTMTMSKSAILGNAIDIASDSHAKKPGSSLSMPSTDNEVASKSEEKPSDTPPEVVPPKVKPKLALKGNKGMITPPGSGLELPKPGSSSKAPGITTPGSGLSSPSGLQAPSGGLKAPGGLQAPSGGLKAPGGLTPPPPPSGDLPPPPPSGGLSLNPGSEVHKPGDLAEGHDKKLSLNSPAEDSNEPPHEDVSETVTTSLNKLKKSKSSKSGKKPLVIMAAIGILLLGGIAFLVTNLLGGSDDEVEKEVAPKEKPIAKAPPKKAPKVEEKFKAFDIPQSREWSYRTASPLKFDLKEASKDAWTLEFWLNLPEQNNAESVRLLNLKLQDEIVLMLKINDGNFCTLKAGEENHKAKKAFRTGKTQYHIALTCEDKELALHINGRYISKALLDKSFDSIVIGNDKLALAFDEFRLTSMALYLAEENFIPSRTLERDEHTQLYIPFEANKNTAELNFYYPKEIGALAIDANSWLNIKQSVLDVSALLSELDNEIIEEEETAVR